MWSEHQISATAGILKSHQGEPGFKGKYIHLEADDHVLRGKVVVTVTCGSQQDVYVVSRDGSYQAR